MVPPRELVACCTTCSTVVSLGILGASTSRTPARPTRSWPSVMRRVLWTRRYSMVAAKRA